MKNTFPTGKGLQKLGRCLIKAYEMEKVRRGIFFLSFIILGHPVKLMGCKFRLEDQNKYASIRCRLCFHKML